MFQFPSNGKVFPNSGNAYVTTEGLNVSIPFKREGLSELNKDVLDGMAVAVSIPFKREGLSERVGECHNRLADRMSVSIPFKREGLSELLQKKFHTRMIRYVSIPFKREGLSEQGEDGLILEGHRLCFNSLQTGRSFRT